MQSLFIEFLRQPSPATYLAVRDALISAPTYAPYSSELRDIGELLRQERWEDAKVAVRAALPHLLLAPRIHLYLAVIAEKAGDDKAANVERMIAAACVKGILATGDGSGSRPYLVTSIADEYLCPCQLAGADFLRSVGRRGSQGTGRFNFAHSSMAA